MQRFNPLCRVLGQPRIEIKVRPNINGLSVPETWLNSINIKGIKNGI